jgi:hypothetical protein
VLHVELVRPAGSAAAGGQDGRETRVYNPVAKNVGSVPATVQIDLLLDGAPVGKPSWQVTIPPAQHETFALHVEMTEYQKVQAGSRLDAGVRFRRWPMGPPRVKLGERRTV